MKPAVFNHAESESREKSGAHQQCRHFVQPYNPADYACSENCNLNLYFRCVRTSMLKY